MSLITEHINVKVTNLFWLNSTTSNGESQTNLRNWNCMTTIIDQIIMDSISLLKYTCCVGAENGHNNSMAFTNTNKECQLVCWHTFTMSWRKSTENQIKENRTERSAVAISGWWWIFFRTVLSGYGINQMTILYNIAPKLILLQY